MKSIDIVSKIVARDGEAKASPSKGIQSINLSDYLLKSVWDKVFEVRTDSQGAEYIFCKLPMVTQYGITMYSGEGVNVPSLASGLPFDGRTIWYNPDTQQIEVIGGTGGGSGEGVSNFWDLSGIPSWITNTKPKYTYSEIEGTPDLTQYALASQIPSLSGYATESWVTKQNYATKATTLSGYGITDAYTKTNVDYLLLSYVTLGGTQTITGEKNFTGGLKVNDSLIHYDTEKKYWKLEGDLLVTGGVTMYGNEGTFTPSTIMDAIAVDGITISKSGGVLKVIGGTGGGVADSVAWANITGKPTWIGSSKPSYSYSEITGAISATELQNYLTSNSYLNVTGGDNRYLKLSGGTLTSTLTISTGNDKKLILNNTDSDANFSRIDFQQNGVSVGQLCIQSVGTTFLSWTGDGGNHRLLHAGNIGSYNAGSATKLQTARTIWGQSFDGTDNVSGSLTLGGSYITGSQGINILDSKSSWVILGEGTNAKGWTTYINGYNINFRCGSGATSGLYIDSTGRVGIGTSAPNTNLHIYSTSNQPLSIIQNYPSTYAEGLIIHNSGLVSGQHSSLCIGYSESTYNRGVLYYYHDGNGSTSNRFGLGLHGVDNVLNILGNGNVGVGTTSPTHKFHVKASTNIPVYIEQSYSYSWAAFLNAYNTSLTSGQHYNINFGYQDSKCNYAWVGYYHAGVGSTSNRLSMGLHSVDDIINILGTGNVGIGTTIPSEKLHVNGYSLIGGNVLIGNGAIGLNRNTYKGGRYDTSSQGWQIDIGSNNLNFYTEGSLGNGNKVQFDASGNILATGGITMYSDQRKKTILNHVELSLKQIADAPLIEHYYNSDEKKTTHVGSIAQYWAAMNDWFCKLDSEGYYTMEIQNAALASAISIARELDRYETKTDKAIKKLKKRICELEEEVERLKSA